MPRRSSKSHGVSNQNRHPETSPSRYGFHRFDLGNQEDMLRCVGSQFTPVSLDGKLADLGVLHLPETNKRNAQLGPAAYGSQHQFLEQTPAPRKTEPGYHGCIDGAPQKSLNPVLLPTMAANHRQNGFENTNSTLQKSPRSDPWALFYASIHTNDEKPREKKSKL
ncbi:predicted protein [Uncinocarpus reesii 1704]|uniref:Uncharacterized protein n=1 Tax=Uncinocarpus reesii (strain UAMH 1704) TaxID=336963 RepID=C4JE12_UNCRE|nr:uncharacterized protein UREG_00436 [Uncinocarpus reesii 1704]EEP75590.1 predicted protein [Uncinocarpus reesii 1704]